MRYFQDEIFRRQGVARAQFIGVSGIGFPLARVDALSFPARHGPPSRMGLDRIAKQLPTNRPSLKAANPDQSLNPNRATRDDVMADFSIRMKNRLQFSSCEAPHIPTSKPHEETLVVELRGNLLTITERRADGGFGSRIYAQRAIDLPEASIFTILPELPSRVRDGSFFSALGTVAILTTRSGEQRRLRAVGTDKNSGLCHGWIFDALEEAGPGSNCS